MFGEVLYWFASEETSNTWISVSQTALKLDALHFTETATLKVLPFEWNVGFRVGIAYQPPLDGWSLLADYTRFTTQGSASVSPSTHFTISSQFFCANANGDVYKGASTQCSLTYDMLDLELGRQWGISPSLFLQPFIGLRGGWIDHTYHLTGTTASSIAAKERVTNDFWGVGPAGGLNTQWIFGRLGKSCFSLLSNFAGAFLWGHWTFKDTYRSSIAQQVELDVPNSSLGALAFRSLLGIGWSSPIQGDRFRIAMQAGYEMEFWLNHLRVPTFFDDRLHHDFTLQGGNFDVSMDF